MVANQRTEAPLAEEERIAITRAKLDALLARHEKEAERLRAELGDPRESLAAFVRETYDQELLAEALQDLIQKPNPWDDWDDDVIDER